MRIQTKILTVRIKKGEDNPNGFIITDAFNAGTEVYVCRNVDQTTLTMCVFPVKDGDENGCYITPEDAKKLGVDLLDTLMVTDASSNKEEKLPNGGALEPARNALPRCLTPLEFDEAISNAETYSEMVEIVDRQFRSFGYSLGSATFKSRVTQVLKEARPNDRIDT